MTEPTSQASPPGMNQIVHQLDQATTWLQAGIRDLEQRRLEQVLPRTALFHLETALRDLRQLHRQIQTLAKKAPFEAADALLHPEAAAELPQRRAVRQAMAALLEPAAAVTAETKPKPELELKRQTELLLVRLGTDEDSWALLVELGRNVIDLLEGQDHDAGLESLEERAREAWRSVRGRGA